jgi:hypothetical protein
MRRRDTNGVFPGQAPILKVPSHHSAVTSKTPMWLDITQLLFLKHRRHWSSLGCYFLNADVARYNSAVISKNADVTGLHSAIISKNADMAQYNSVVTSKTPTSPVITRLLYLKRRGGSKGLGYSKHKYSRSANCKRNGGKARNAHKTRRSLLHYIRRGSIFTNSL